MRRNRGGLTMRAVCWFVCCVLQTLPLLAWAVANADMGTHPGFARGTPSAEPALPVELDAEGRLDWQCLRASYPQITGLVSDAQGLWLLLQDGKRVPYVQASGQAEGEQDFWVTDVRSAMADAYPLEPQRPDTPAGVAPGRRRSYALLEAMYGDSPEAVKARLRPVVFFGQRLWLTASAASALSRAESTLRPVVERDSALRRLLKTAGGFYWRRIAGEKRLSPHAYGIAFDISPHIATYWRWSSLRPHPMQKTYPQAIVQALENEGFIWGGKWHEYDLMHFEYRPEIICKARFGPQTMFPVRPNATTPATLGR